MKITRKTGAVFLIMLLGLFLAACSKTGEANEQQEVQTITVEDLQSNLEKEDWVVLDTRTNEGIIAPAKEGVEREGYIQGALAFSVEFIADARDDQIEALLRYKEITPDKHIVLYDANRKDATKVAAFLADKGFKNLYLFDLKEWAANPDLPMDSNVENCCI